MNDQELRSFHHPNHNDDDDAVDDDDDYSIYALSIHRGEVNENSCTFRKEEKESNEGKEDEENHREAKSSQPSSGGR